MKPRLSRPTRKGKKEKRKRKRTKILEDKCEEKVVITWIMALAPTLRLPQKPQADCVTL
jgi:hypothetical protein